MCRLSLWPTRNLSPFFYLSLIVRGPLAWFVFCAPPPLPSPPLGCARQAARIFRSNYQEVFQRLAEACRGSGGDHDADILEAVILLLVALTQAISADVRLAATLAGMEVCTYDAARAHGTAWGAIFFSDGDVCCFVLFFALLCFAFGF